jgi:hypothetical protein
MSRAAQPLRVLHTGSGPAVLWDDFQRSSFIDCVTRKVAFMQTARAACRPAVPVQRCVPLEVVHGFCVATDRTAEAAGAPAEDKAVDPLSGTQAGAP